MKKLLVTGASGFLGWHVCRLASAGWEVFGTFHRHPVELPGAKTIRLDLRDCRSTQALFRTLAPDAVIHAAAAAKTEFCQAYPHDSLQINVGASCTVAALCADSGIPCVYTSTDLVFDGTLAPYKETDPPAPVSKYGEQKTQAEEKMRQIYPDVIVARLPLLFGEAGPVSGSFLQALVAALKAGKALRLFTDEVRTPVSAEAAASGLLLALENAERTLHLGGPERISRYDLGKKACEILGFDLSLLIPCRQDERPELAPRPKDVSLDSSLAFALGYAPKPSAFELKRMLRPLGQPGGNESRD